MRLAEAVGLALTTNNMSPASPRKSSESVRSGISTPSISHYSLSQLESPREPPRKYALRRGSTASSIVTIGSVLDSSFQHGAIAESGHNGENLVVRWWGSVNAADWLSKRFRPFSRIPSSVRD